MESTTQVIQFKQKLLQEAPGSARRIDGIDKIFYMSVPGQDAILSGTGTVTFRRGWGASPTPTRYGGVVAADLALRKAGYKPYNIFYGNEWQLNEMRHVQAKQQRKQEQTVFERAEVPKYSKKDAQNTFLNNSIGYEYPSMEIPTNINPASTKKVNGQNYYLDFLQQLPDPVRDARNLNRRILGSTMNENQFAAYSNASYGNVRRLEGQLGIPGFGKAVGITPKTKGKKLKNKKTRGEGYDFIE